MIGGGVKRASLLVLPVLYLVGLLVGPAGGAYSAMLLALLAGGSSFLGYQAASRLSSQYAPLLAWPTVHLLLLAGGGVGGPLLALAAVWAVALAHVSPTILAWPAAGGALALTLGADWLAGALEPAAGLAAGVAILAGCGGGILLRGSPMRSLGPRPTPVPDATRHAAGADLEPPESDPARVLASAVDSVRTQTGARRVVLWEVVEEGKRALARVTSGGDPPRDRSLSGDPMRWVHQEKLPLRLEQPPRSLLTADDSAACIVPVDDERLLTIELAAVDLPADASFGEDAARYLAELLSLQKARLQSASVRHRFEQLVALLRDLAAAQDTTAFATRLAEAAVLLTGGSGASAADWDDEQGGRVLALVGGDGGPKPGMTCPARGNELALAARGGGIIHRKGLRPGRRQLPLAGEDERWYAEPRAFAVVPLTAGDHQTDGLLAVWTADRADLVEEGLEALRTIAPYASLQLRLLNLHATLRARVDTDSLTRLPNRGVFNEKLAVQVARYRRYRRPVSLILFDIDHFKRINDTWGHEAGDHVLVAVAQVLAGSVRETDLAARFGGEEFVLLLDETNLQQALETAERVRQSLQSLHIEWKGDAIPVRASFGVSACPACVEDPSELITSADSALYAAKETGRNRVVAADPGAPS